VRRVFYPKLVTEVTDTRDQGLSVTSVTTSLRAVSKTSLSLSSQAIELFDTFREGMEPRLAPDGDLRSFTDYVAKHEGRVARIAGVLHLAEHDLDDAIGEATMVNALRIGEYLLEHTIGAVTVRDEQTRRALAWLEGREKSTVSKRDFHRGLVKRGTAEDVDELVAKLERLDAIREVEPDHNSRGRPASPRFDISPYLRGTNVSLGDGWWKDGWGSAVEPPGEEDHRREGEQPALQDLTALRGNAANRDDVPR
jgi:hypothetical protein